MQESQSPPLGSNQEWVRAVLSHQGPLPVPFQFIFTPPARRILETRFGSPLEEALDIPVRKTAPASIKPMYPEASLAGTLMGDEFSVTWQANEIDRGTPIRGPLTEASLGSYTFPDSSSAHRHAHLADWCRANRKHYTVLWIGDLWERATFLRGMENLLVDLMDNPAFVDELLERINEYNLETLRVATQSGSFDAVALMDDYGTQSAMLISPGRWRQTIRPLLKRFYAAVKSSGMTVWHHSCGNIEPIIPDLIDIGLDVLHPIQPEAMDVFALKRDYGRDLAFCGGVPTQGLLPNGSPDSIRTHVRKLKETLGYGGGYILDAGMALQADVPPENLVALMEEAVAR